MRVALALGFALAAGAAGAADCPTRVDLIVIGQAKTVEIQDIFAPEDGELLLDQPFQITADLTIERVLRGRADGKTVRVTYVDRWGYGGGPSVFYVRRDADGVFRVTCHHEWFVESPLAARNDADLGVQIPKAWRTEACRPG